MIAPVYQLNNVSDAIQDATRLAMMQLCRAEGWLDSKNTPTPHDGGVIYQDNEMAFVAYVADEGAVKFSLHGPTLRALATQFGYEKSANCKAMVLECVENDLIVARIENGEQVLNMTPYGWETLKRWEWFRENDV